MATLGGAAVVLVLALAAAVILLLASPCHHTSQPHCPTEDSCSVSYEHGHWTIREVTP